MVILTLIGFYWIAYVSHVFGYMPLPLAAGVLLLFSATVHLYIPLSFLVGYFLQRRLSLPSRMAPLIVVCAISLGESYWPSLFPWNFGYTFLWIKSPLAQWADAVGFLGLSFLAHLTSVALLVFVSHENNGFKKYRYPLILGLLWIFLYFSGQHRASAWEDPRQTLRVLQVQANISNQERMAAESGMGNLDSILQRFLDLTSQGLQQSVARTDLVLWPEAAFPDFLNRELRHRPLPQKLWNYLDQTGISLITGSFSVTSDSKGKAKVYNSLFLLEAGGNQSQPVDKTLLLPFGDYTPLADRYSWIAKLSPAGVGFAHGEGPKVFPYKDLVIGGQICYEGLYPSFSSDLTRQGADMFVNLTNDSWFGPTSEPHQHMIITLGRAVEFRRPLIRTTNTGITTAITATGKILEQSPVFSAWQGFFEIPIPKNDHQTFYSRYYYLLHLVPLLIVLACIGRKFDFERINEMKTKKEIKDDL